MPATPIFSPQYQFKKGRGILFKLFTATLKREELG
jgi:hypothetical protein